MPKNGKTPEEVTNPATPAAKKEVNKTAALAAFKAIDEADKKIEVAKHNLEAAQKSKSDAIKRLAEALGDSQRVAHPSTGVPLMIVQRGETFFLRGQNQSEVMKLT